MSATNLTKNLKLPQFLASDKPSWLGDVNGAMLNIDNGYGTLTADISNANDTASSAKSQSDANTQTLVNVNSELESQGNRITALEAGGGTEQLEQRVGTLETDVESLQTRADTFEEEIADGSTNITNLTGRVTTVEGKVKTNEDNITSLQNTTSGLTTSVETLETKVNNASKNAIEAKALVTEVSNKNLKFMLSNIINSTYSYKYSAISIIYDKNTISIQPFLIGIETELGNNYVKIGEFIIPKVFASITDGDGEENNVVAFSTDNASTINAYINIIGNKASIFAKNDTGSSARKVFCISLHEITGY